MKIIGIIVSIIIIVIATVVFLLTPTIKLNGNPSMEVSMAEGYKEPGCAAKYAFLDISSHIKTESAVNDKKVGEYKVTYSVSFLKKSAKAVRKVTVVDKEPPEIVLRGGDEIKVEQYSSFKDPGYTVVDDSDGDITQKATAKGIVDTYNPGKYTISYHAVDSYGNKATHERTVNVESGSDSDEEKVIYLTFDDGPSSAVTPEVLDVLKKYDVPATFFILDYGDSEENISLLKKAISQGHTIGIHGYSHDYGEIYKTYNAYGNTLGMTLKNDTALQKERQRIEENMKRVRNNTYNIYYREREKELQQVNRHTLYPDSGLSCCSLVCKVLYREVIYQGVLVCSQQGDVV